MSSRNKAEIPGNAVESAAMHTRMLVSTGRKVHEMAYVLEKSAAEEFMVRRITFRCDGDPRGSWLAIITGDDGSGPVVAFHSGDGLTATIEGLAAKIRNGSLKWKEDQYADKS